MGILDEGMLCGAINVSASHFMSPPHQKHIWMKECVNRKQMQPKFTKEAQAEIEI